MWMHNKLTKALSCLLAVFAVLTMLAADFADARGGRGGGRGGGGGARMSAGGGHSRARSSGGHRPAARSPTALFGVTQQAAAEEFCLEAAADVRQAETSIVGQSAAPGVRRSEPATE